VEAEGPRGRRWRGRPPLPWRHELDIGGRAVYVPVPAPYPLAPFFAPPPPFYPQS